MYSKLSNDQLELVWSFKAGDWWDSVDESWHTCDRCGVRPRIWCFDNGSYATCLCYDMYDRKPVQTECVMSVFNRTGLTTEYSRDKLRTAWNLFAKDGIERNQLETGKW